MADPRRAYALTVVGGVVAGGLAYVATGRQWATTTVSAEGMPPVPIAVTGKDGLPLVTALSLVVMAASVAVLATRGIARRFVGAVMVAAGVVITIGAATAHDAVQRAVLDAAAKAAAPATSADMISWTWWPWVASAAGVIAVCLGVVCVLSGPAWPSMGSRYTRTSRADRPQKVTEESESIDLWRSLDQGRDPTDPE